METVFLAYRFVGTRHKTVTRTIQKCVCGFNFSLRRAGQQKTSRSPSESDTFKELHQCLEPFNLLSHIQKKIQEALDKEKLAALIRNQTSNREEARLQSLCMPHSGAWLAAPPIPAIGLHLSAEEFQVSVKYRLGISVYDQERKCRYCKSGKLDTFGDHAVACLGKGDEISRHDRIRDRIASACSAASFWPICCSRHNLANLLL